MPEKEPVTDIQEIGAISNYHGGLKVAKIGDNYGWVIEDYDDCTNFDDPDEYQLIPKYLYDALIKFENEREK